MKGNEQFPEVISSSLRATFNECYAKFYWAQIRGLTPMGENKHYVFGGAYAHALEFFRSNYFRGNSFEDSAAAGLEALMLSYGDFNPEDNDYKSFDRCIGAYIEYLYRFNPKDDHIQTSVGPNGVPRVEFSFAVAIPEVPHPVTGNPLIFSGRFDQLAEYNGALFVFDDKTTQRLGATWSAQWDHRSQFTGYCYGAGQHDLPVVGAIIRGMGIYKTKFDTIDAITHRPKFMVDRWRERLTWDLRRMVEAWRSQYWPHTGEESGACSHYGSCPYAPLCLTPSPESYLGSYVEHRYKPLELEGERNRDLHGKFLELDPLLSKEP